MVNSEYGSYGAVRIFVIMPRQVMKFAGALVPVLRSLVRRVARRLSRWVSVTSSCRLKVLKPLVRSTGSWGG